VSEPDPVVRRLREEISELDRAVLDSVNARLMLVAELKRHKEAHGIDFVDPDREARMLADLLAANGGPLSAQGVGELLAALLDLTKRELES
jgi:chorismate mutase